MRNLDAIELARAIYAHHRRAKLRAKRRTAPVPTWEELDEDEQVDRVRAAARLLLAYRRATVRESRVG